MRKAIESGTILIKDGTLLPEALRVDGETFVSGWTQVNGLDGHELDRRIRESGWTFFYLAGEINRVVSKHFLGVPCTQVYAHPRHVQKSIFLFRDEDVQKSGQTKISGDANPSAVHANGKVLPLEEIITQPGVATS